MDIAITALVMSTILWAARAAFNRFLAEPTKNPKTTTPLSEGKPWFN